MISWIFPGAICLAKTKGRNWRVLFFVIFSFFFLSLIGLGRFLEFSKFFSPSFIIVWCLLFFMLPFLPVFWTIFSWGLTPLLWFHGINLIPPLLTLFQSVWFPKRCLVRGVIFSNIAFWSFVVIFFQLISFFHGFLALFWLNYIQRNLNVGVTFKLTMQFSKWFFRALGISFFGWGWV